MKNSKSKANGNPSGGVDWKEVNKALDFMNQNGLDEFEFAQGDLHIRLRKPSLAPLANAAPVAPQAAATTPSAAAGPAPTAAPATAPPSTEAAANNLHVVKSPIVGTFYASPNPQAGPYVKVGDRVKAGQVLCIIEAMKLMNEIESDVSGEVVRVLVDNAQPVEYGEGLFAIRVG
jgi:acetyl-CoA carboxylase biotin carboxyl carrier protein